MDGTRRHPHILRYKRRDESFVYIICVYVNHTHAYNNNDDGCGRVPSTYILLPHNLHAVLTHIILITNPIRPLIYHLFRVYTWIHVCGMMVYMC